MTVYIRSLFYILIKADIIKIDFSNLPARDAQDPKDRWE